MKKAELIFLKLGYVFPECMNKYDIFLYQFLFYENLHLNSLHVHILSTYELRRYIQYQYQSLGTFRWPRSKIHSDSVRRKNQIKLNLNAPVRWPCGFTNIKKEKIFKSSYLFQKLITYILNIMLNCFWNSVASNLFKNGKTVNETWPDWLRLKRDF